MRPAPTSTSRRWIGSAAINLTVLCVLVGAVLLIRPLLPPIDLAPVQAFESKPGIQGGTALNDDGNVDFPNSLRSNLPLIQESGAGWVRIHFRLGSHYQDWTTKDSRGISAIEYYDVLIQESRAHGLKVLGLISNESWPGTQAAWTANNAEYDGGNGDNAYLQAFSKRAAAVLVEHFQGQVDEWEIWDEPNAFATNDGGMPRGGTYIYPSNFAQLLRHVYEDTRPYKNVRLVSGGILASDSGLRSRQSAGQYLSETYRLGRNRANWETLQARYGSYPLNDIGVHVYVDQGQTTTSAKVKAYVEEIRSAYVAYEGPKTAKRLIVTEFGWSTSMVSQRVQAENLQTAYATFKGLAYVRNAFWCLAQDTASPDGQYGLQTAGAKANQYQGVPKLGLEAYKEAAIYQPPVEVLGIRVAGSVPMKYGGVSSSEGSDATTG